MNRLRVTLGFVLAMASATNAGAGEFDKKIAWANDFFAGFTARQNFGVESAYSEQKLELEGDCTLVLSKVIKTSTNSSNGIQHTTHAQTSKITLLSEWNYEIQSEEQAIAFFKEKKGKHFVKATLVEPNDWAIGFASKDGSKRIQTEVDYGSFKSTVAMPRTAFFVDSEDRARLLVIMFQEMEKKCKSSN